MPDVILRTFEVTPTNIRLFSGAALAFAISGKTINLAGDRVPGASVKLFRSDTDVKVAETVSDGVGEYTIALGNTDKHYLVFYKDGVPDIAGTTSNEVEAV